MKKVFEDLLIMDVPGTASSNRPRIHIDGLVTLTLQFQHSQVALVQIVKT